MSVVNSLDLNNVLRSAALVIIGLPLTGGLAVGVISNLPAGETRSTKVQESLKADLTRPCLDYVLSKGDSRLEREAKNEVDEVLGGQANYGETCRWVLT